MAEGSGGHTAGHTPLAPKALEPFCVESLISHLRTEGEEEAGGGGLLWVGMGDGVPLSQSSTALAGRMKVNAVWIVNVLTTTAHRRCSDRIWGSKTAPWRAFAPEHIEVKGRTGNCPGPRKETTEGLCVT